MSPLLWRKKTQAVVALAILRSAFELLTTGDTNYLCTSINNATYRLRRDLSPYKPWTWKWFAAEDIRVVLVRHIEVCIQRYMTLNQYIGATYNVHLTNEQAYDLRVEWLVTMIEHVARSQSLENLPDVPSLDHVL